MKGISRRLQWAIPARVLGNCFRNRPLVLSFEVTLSCPAHCRHCDTGGIKPGEKRLAPHQFRRYIDELQPVAVQLSGGEPLLRQDLPAIVRTVKNGHTLPYVIVVSNGLLLDEGRYEELKEAGADRFSISLDFPNTQHDDFRRLPGLYAHLADLIPRLAARGHHDIAMNSAITSANLPYLRELADRAAEWGVSISYSAYSPLRTGDRSLLIEGEQELASLHQAIEELLQLKKNSDTILNASSALRDTYRYFKEGGRSGCSAGRRFLVVRPDGTLNGCSMHRERQYATQPEILADFAATNTCRGCYVAIRAYSDKSVWGLAKDALEAARR